MKKFLLISLLVLFFAGLAVGCLMWKFAKNQAKKPEIIGVTFSQIQAERFGVDWQENYLALLDDLHFKNLRLIAYWNRVEPEKDRYDFSELDWMMDEAAKRNAKVILTVGQKLPRWPECYYPVWLDKDNPDQANYRANKYISEMIKRYKNHPALYGWQLENEFLLRSYGKCPSKNLTRDQLKKELSTIKSLDQSHPIMLSQSDEFGWPIFGPFADKFGFSLYKRVWMENLHGYFRYPQPGWYNWLKATIINLYSGQDIIVHELQAESWAETGNEFISLEEMDKTMNSAYLDENIRYVRASKIREYYLWGSEWWYYMKTKKDSPAMWEKIKELLART